MEFSAYQILTPIVSLVAIAYAWNLVLRDRKTVWEATLWMLFWGFIAAIALFPDMTSYLSSVMGVKDRVNALFVTSFGILFLMVFYIVVRIEELEQRQTRFIRKISLKQADLHEEEEGKEKGK